MIETIIKSISKTASDDADRIVEEILLNDELNLNYADIEATTESLALGVEVYEAMIKGIGEKEAKELLEVYEEKCNEVHEEDRRHWLRIGIRIGFAFSQIIQEKVI